ncbi:vitamin K epoxide reductase family protein [Flagellimonas sediminis]|uniref:Peptidase C39 domain-containing protein n=1 Tax=Flagellimonas sediminis TaxID=2696468 RepID=A0A6I5L9P4_9FLAO|nr:vitamin K epoxide reductase family protein [Allomuricauda sediminis]NDV45420.1 hypothetical protein [Allomuricauda sediminis]
MKNDLVLTTGILLEKLKIKNTNGFLKSKILSHPDYPSLNAISDTLSVYNIENIAVKIDSEKFGEIPLPCISQVDLENIKSFIVIEKVLNGRIYFYNNRGKLINMSAQNFSNIWSGICLLCLKSEYSSEPNLRINILKTLADKFLLIGLLLCLGALLTSNLLFSTFLKESGTLNIFLFSFYLCLKFFGLSLSISFLSHEIKSSGSAFIRKYCSFNSHVDCDVVLNSEYSSIPGTSINLGSLCFTYFFGSILFFVLSEFSDQSISIAAHASFGVFPILIWSLILQAFVIKQFCRLCIAIQIIILFEIILSYLGNFYVMGIQFKLSILFVTTLVAPIYLWNIIKPLIVQEIEWREKGRFFKKLKNYKFVFEYFLQKSKWIQNPPSNLSLSLLNNTSNDEIILVIDPYCRYSTEAFRMFQELFSKEIINLTIIFIPTIENSDGSNELIKYITSLKDYYKDSTVQDALSTWFWSPKKNMKEFKEMFPIDNFPLESEDSNFWEIKEWCLENGISRVPTIIYNNRLIPDNYTVEDLRYILLRQ